MVGEEQRWLVAAEAFDGELAEGAAFERDRVFVVAGGLVLAGAVKPGLGSPARGQLLERGDQLRGALAQRDEGDAQLVELGEVLVGGELSVEHQQLRQLAMGALIEAAELDHLA